MKRTKKPKTKQPTLNALGTLEDMEDPDYLPAKREEYKKHDATEQYYEMLETQINSLVDKVLYQTSPRDLVLYHPESDSYFLGSKRDIEDHVQVAMTTEELLNKLSELLNQSS